MAENETPQPITREEFEAGVKFYIDEDRDNFRATIRANDRIILNQHGSYYCLLNSVDEYGFTVSINIFGTMQQMIILFRNCKKLK